MATAQDAAVMALGPPTLPGKGEAEVDIIVLLPLLVDERGLNSHAPLGGASLPTSAGTPAARRRSRLGRLRVVLVNARRACDASRQYR